MKIAKLALLAAVLPLARGYANPEAVPASQFISRVFFVIHESTPQQIQRGRQIIEKEFAQTVSAVPGLQAYRYQVVSDGNQIVFSMVTPDDTRAPFQEAVSDLVGQINGRFRTRGRYDFMKASLEAMPESYLEVALDESNTKIQSIVARSVPLRDLLAELKMQFGDPVPYGQRISFNARAAAPRFSYMIPADCASRQIDWSFGAAPDPKAAPKSLDEAMKEIAKVMNLSVENHQGTFIFSGDCPRNSKSKQASAMELLPTRWIPLEDLQQQNRAPRRPIPLLPVSAIE